MLKTKRVLDPKSTETKDLHQYLLGSVAPRPIAFVATRDEQGRDNLAPYSFFNAFSSNPPILVFSSNRRVKDNTTKDTLANVYSQKEAVINMVNFDIVRQTSLASVEYDAGINEFEKAGLTALPALMVNASRVAESPVNIEVKVTEIIPLGEHGGAGHLIICEVVMMHIDEEVLDEDRIDPHKMDLMGRMGRAYYVRASGAAIYSIYQDILTIPLGFDRLDSSITKSHILTGNDIAQLASLHALPTASELESVMLDYPLSTLCHDEIHKLAADTIAVGSPEIALRMLYASL